jgi:hypothetical protein
MPRGIGRLVLGGTAAALAAAAALRPVTVLEVESEARGETAAVALAAGERFAVVSAHSMYDAPVTEEFAVDGDGRIALVAVSSPSAAVREYFGLTALGERQLRPRTLDEVVFRVAAGEVQRLQAAGRERSFLEFGDHGDRLVVRAARRPAAAGWLSRLR